MRSLMKVLLGILLSIALMTGALAPTLTPAVRAQGSCGDAPAPRLSAGGSGRVTFSNGQPLNVRMALGLGGQKIGQLDEGTDFNVLEGPVCADNIYWWHIQAAVMNGWVAEGQSGDYFVEPVVPQAGPVAPLTPSGPFVAWNWGQFVGTDSWMSDIPDPMAIQLPAGYAGNLPALPVDLNSVKFANDPGLNDAQRALLAQNGFVVIPAGFEQFSNAYGEDDVWWTYPDNLDWQSTPTPDQMGHAYFVTTDAMLHSLHYVFDNLLTDLEKNAFVPIMVNDVLTPMVQTAVAQAQSAQGTPLATPAYNAALYLTVALELFQPGAAQTLVSPQMLADASTVVQMAMAGEGQGPIDFLNGYLEDFSQYRPRGHYAGDVTLEQYFRAMIWLGRITFLANDDAQNEIALLVLRTLRSAPGAAQGWQNVHDTLTFLVGPVDDLTPLDYSTLSDAIFGPEMALDRLSDPALLAQFKAQVAQLPGPRINGLIVSNDTTAEELASKTRGFRLMGQRFTFDGYVMQQLMYPYVGTRENPRLLPLGLDVPSVLGPSTIAQQLLANTGVSSFANYDLQADKMRTEAGALTQDQWLENTYGGWLWALDPLWNRDSAMYPPMMSTEAWLRKDLQTGLASWTELKHDTVLYIKQPGGLGGGGAPLTSFGYVEPNPLVFARIAVVAAMTYQGLTARAMDQQMDLRGYQMPGTDGPDKVTAYLRQYEINGLQATLYQLKSVATQSAQFAEMARKELAGEPLTEDEYWAIYHMGTFLYSVLYALWSGDGPPDPVALVTDVASNPSAQSVLQEAVGGVDYIYAVVPTPYGGTQLVRGGVFSYYEWVGNINQRMTDQEWRAQVKSGSLPARPDWVSTFFSP